MIEIIVEKGALDREGFSRPEAEKKDPAPAEGVTEKLRKGPG